MKIMRKKQYDCMHHDLSTKDSWIKSALIDLGARKMFWCKRCGQVWFR